MQDKRAERLFRQWESVLKNPNTLWKKFLKEFHLFYLHTSYLYLFVSFLTKFIHVYPFLYYSLYYYPLCVTTRTNSSKNWNIKTKNCIKIWRLSKNRQPIGIIFKFKFSWAKNIKSFSSGLLFSHLPPGFSPIGIKSKPERVFSDCGVI